MKFCLKQALEAKVEELPVSQFENYIQIEENEPENFACASQETVTKRKKPRRKGSIPANNLLDHSFMRSPLVLEEDDVEKDPDWTTSSKNKPKTKNASKKVRFYLKIKFGF